MICTISANLPLKLLAVRSGLAEYGKNNVSYIGGMGSFYRLAAFVSDLPFSQDNFLELAVMEQCKECNACLKACPTEAIASDRFLLHGERCLTFHNERDGEFPNWINPSWHNCLVGCMICQKVCPVDKDFRKEVVVGPVFSEGETACLLGGIFAENMPDDLADKIKQLDMMEYLCVLGRNLKALTAM